MKFIDKFSSQIAGRILILGYGREGKSSYNFIKKYLPKLDVYVYDKSFGEYEKDNFLSGDSYDCFIDDFDMILKSPGIVPSEKLLSSSKMSSQIEIFLNIFSKQTVGITGTKGKSTVTTLIYRMLKRAGKDVLIGGNIGIPVFDLVESINDDTLIVLELSCHQLQKITKAPHWGVFLNLYPEHLDFYGTFDKYSAAKKNISFHQNSSDFMFYPDNEFNRLDGLGTHYPVEIVDEGETFDIISPSLDKNIMVYKNSIGLIGSHNHINIAVALSVCCKIDDTKLNSYLALVKEFNGLPHRLEYVGEVEGLKYYNDSISTIPETTIAGLKAFGDCVDILILGGYDRGISYDHLIKYIRDKAKIKYIFLLPDTGKKIYESLKGDNVKYFDTLDLLLQFVKSEQIKGVCLFSPAAASYNCYKNFEERGDKFKKLVLKG